MQEINGREGNPSEFRATRYHSATSALVTIITIVNRSRRRQ
jgi:hypothetical protein